MLVYRPSALQLCLGFNANAMVSICFLTVYWMKSTCFVSISHVCPHSIGQWTIPTVTGDTPPPVAEFSFTKISSDQAVMFGGQSPEITYLSDLRLASVSRDSVVGMSLALSFSCCAI